MRALFVTADLGGNVPPTLAVAEALTRHGTDDGVEVSVEVAGLGSGAGADAGALVHRVAFKPAEAIRPEGRNRGVREFGAFRRLLMSRDVSDATRALIAERRPDVVIVDGMLPAPLRGALDAGGVPVVTLLHTFGAFWVRSFDRGPMGRVFATRGLRPSALWARSADRLLLTDGELDPGEGDPALAGYHWTGTTEVGVDPAPRGDRPRILVSLSASEWPGMRPVYRRIVAALAELPVDAIVTTGGVDLGGDIAGAANVEVRGWVAHADVLLPINPTADQRMIGGVIEAAGLGRRLPKSAGVSRIRATVAQMLDDTDLRERAAATGRRLRAAPAGADVAAARILTRGRRVRGFGCSRTSSGSGSNRCCLRTRGVVVTRSATTDGSLRGSRTGSVPGSRGATCLVSSSVPGRPCGSGTAAMPAMVPGIAC